MISVIVYGRNDSHGYNLPKRAALSFNCIAEVLTQPNDEIIFVDCNTPDDMPTFPESIADTLTPRAKQLLRILRVRSEQYEKGKNGTKFKVLEPLCRNIAIRRSNPKNRWILNTNTDMVFVPLRNGSLSDVCEKLRDGFYELPRFEVPEMLWESTDRKDPVGIIKAFHRWGTRLHINEVVYNKPEILFDGPGDFQLALREQMFAIHGMNEQMVLGWHVDSNLCRRLFLVNGKTDHLLDEVYAYHCDHTRLNTVYHNTKDSTSNDWMKFVNLVTSPQIPEQATTWGLPSETIEELRLTDEPAARYIRIMEEMLPGMTKPMLTSALTEHSWNHGLLYDNAHVLPYLADHLSVIPPYANVGYIGANVELVAGIAHFREKFGHSGKILLNEQILRIGGGLPTSLIDRCKFVSIDEVYEGAGLMCVDLWQGNFPSITNRAGFTVPAPGFDQGRFGAAMVRVFLDFAQREKNHLGAKGTAARKFLFVGTQNSWFESATVQLFGLVMAPYSTYVRHGFIRSDAFTQTWQPLPINDLIMPPMLRDQIATFSEKLGRPVSDIDFLLAQLLVEELSITPAGENPPSARIAGLMDSQLLGETLRFKQLEYGATGQLAQADRLDVVEAEWDETFAKLKAQTVAVSAAPKDNSSIRRVVVDAMTFFSRSSMDRGIGHYTRHHLVALAKSAPQISFVLTSSNEALPKEAQELLEQPNISYRKLSECRSEEFDLFHVPDPMTTPAGPDSWSELFPELPLSAVFYDLTPLRFYFAALFPVEKKQYLTRLLALRTRNATLLTISDYTRHDLIQSNFFAQDRIFPIYAGLNQAPQPPKLSRSEELALLKKFGITKPFFIHVGAIDPHKNFEGVISSLGLTGRIDDCQLVVVGRKQGAMGMAAENVKASRLSGVILFTDFISRENLEVLYALSRGLVFMSYYEGFGFPVLEAMARQCPVICSNTTSVPEVAGDAALTFAPADHKSIAKGMVQLLEDKKLRKTMQERGLVQAAKFPWSLPAEKTLAAWGYTSPTTSNEADSTVKIGSASAVSFSAKVQTNSSSSEQSEAARVDWYGSFLDCGSLSVVNRCITEKLAYKSSVSLTRVGDASLPHTAEFHELAKQLQPIASAETQVTVRHQWPPDWKRPRQGALVVMQPWEFGSLPADWVKASSQVDEFWAYTNYVRNVYISSGVDAAKVKVVPLGIDPTLFRSDAPARSLATKKKFKFVFVGGTISRKGPDVLLKAYLENFTAADDVCLVIKDFGGKGVYAGQTLEAQIKAIQANPNAPEICYINEELPAAELPSLYTACDCFVHPYRGEGFGLPILEAMACGLPVVVTAGGSADDFATHEFAYRIPAQRRSIGDSVSGMKLAGEGWMLEPDSVALGAKMKWVVANREDARALGVRASSHARQNWTWDRSASVAAERLSVIAQQSKSSSTASPVSIVKKAKPQALPTVAKLGDLTKAEELFRKKSPRAAWEAASEAIRLRPHHPEAFLLLAEIARMVGDSASARACANHSLALAPLFKPAKKFLKGNFQGNTKLEWLVLPPSIERHAKKAKPTLSVCLIVKNEERFIRQCLASVKDFADQIVVVDTGSTDKTVAIAKEFGAEIHEFKWCDDFSAARNAALQHVTGEWVLSFDADEELPVENREAFRRLLDNESVISWRLPLFDIGRENEGCNYVPRLFRNAPTLHFVGRVHEQVFYSVEARRIEWGLENRIGDAALLHHGYTKELIKERGKIERNLKLLELAIEELPGDPLLHMNLGLELCRSERVYEGVSQYKIAFDVMSQLPVSAVTPETREALLTQYCTYLRVAKRQSELLPVLTSALARQGELTASQHFLLGLAQIELEQFTPAAEQMRLCLEKRGKRNFTPINADILTVIPQHSIALCLWHTKDTKGADEAFRAAILEAPAAAKVHVDYARFLNEQGNPGDALQLLNQFASQNPTEASIWSAGGQIALSQPGLLEVAVDWTTVAIAHHPENPGIIAQRAEALLLSGNLQDALPLWKHVSDRDPKPRALSARILCEVALGNEAKIPSGMSSASISQDFTRWYWRLVEFGAEPTVLQLHATVDSLERTLPAAAELVRSVIAKLGLVETV